MESGKLVMAGKATLSNKIGLSANVADEEQSLLQMDIAAGDNMADLKHLAGLPGTGLPCPV